MKRCVTPTPNTTRSPNGDLVPMTPTHWNTSRRNPILDRSRPIATPHEKKLTLLAAVLGTSVVFLDATVTSVALPAIRSDLGGGLAGQQWVTNSYLLALGSLLLIGGSLGD